MKLKFVEDAVVDQLVRGRRSAHNWADFIEELYKYPNQWAEFPEKIQHSRTGYRLPEIYKDIQVRISGGNNLANNHPDKLNWTVYVRYVPSVQEDDTF